MVRRQPCSHSFAFGMLVIESEYNRQKALHPGQPVAILDNGFITLRARALEPAGESEALYHAAHSVLAGDVEAYLLRMRVSCHQLKPLWKAFVSRTA